MIKRIGHFLLKERQTREKCLQLMHRLEAALHATLDASEEQYASILAELKMTIESIRYQSLMLPIKNAKIFTTLHRCDELWDRYNTSSRSDAISAQHMADLRGCWGYDSKDYLRIKSIRQQLKQPLVIRALRYLILSIFMDEYLTVDLLTYHE